MKTVDDGGNPPASPRSNAIEQNGVENPDPHDFANNGRSERLKVSLFDGQKSEAPGYFDAGEQEEKPVCDAKELCYPVVLKTLIFVQNAGWAIYGIRSLSMHKGGRSSQNKTN